MAKFSLISLSLSALLPLSLAQTSIVTILLPDFDVQSIQASVITANPTMTSYLLACPPGTNDTDCGLGSTGIHVLEGPATFEAHVTWDPYTNDISCTITTKASQTDAQCAQTSVGPAGTMVSNVNMEAIHWAMPVTITAGLEKLATTTGASETLVTAPSKTGASAAPTSKSSSALMARVTGNVVVAGVAAVLGGAMMV